MALDPKTGKMIPVHLTVAGRMDDPGYQQCKVLVQELAKLNKYTTFDLVPLVEVEWEAHLKTKKMELGGTAWQHQGSPLAYYNGCNYIGSTAELANWASRVLSFKMVADEQQCARAGQEELTAWLANRHPHSFCYLDLSASNGDGEASTHLGRLVFELYDNVCPKTCENFRALCRGDNKGLHYLGVPIHRVARGGWVQGGDVFEGAGRGDGGGQEGQSIFGGPFEDESFEVLHDRPGILGMANVGPHTNGSQFYVTKNAAPWLDQKKVAFGRVVTGMRVLDALEALPLENQRPVQPVTVAGCGEYAGPTSESKTAAKSE